MRRVKLRGAPGSPYTRKMLALLRYRQIPYELIVGGSLFASTDELPTPKVELLPTFFFPDSDGELQAVVDSTPIIRQLESDYLERSVLPSDPALAFLDYLLEDYGDEWLTKAMFHYRWYYADDIERAGEILPRWRGLQASDEQIAPMSKMFRDRQIGRLYVVGSNDVTAPVIEESYQRLLTLLSAHIERSGFLLGGRPAASDFALFGQLTQLAAFDPTPMAECFKRAPRVYAWVSVVEDLSGLSPTAEQWHTRESVPETLRALFAELGKTYVPALLANAQAVDSGAETVETEIDGRRWTQQPFPYQAKCLQWIRQEYMRLDAEDRAWVDDFLAGTGCLALVER